MKMLVREIRTASLKWVYTDVGRRFPTYPNRFEALVLSIDWDHHVPIHYLGIRVRS